MRQASDPAAVTRRDLLGVGMAALAGAGLTASLRPGAAAAADDPPSVALIKRYYQTYAEQQPEKLKAFFADDIEWHIPGHHPLAGTKRGAEEVLAFFELLAESNFKAELIYIGGDDKHVVDVHRGWSNREAGPNVDTTWVLLYRIEDDRIREARNFSFDQHAADAFFWKAYKLRALPDRLAQ